MAELAVNGIHYNEDGTLLNKVNYSGHVGLAHDPGLPLFEAGGRLPYEWEYSCEEPSFTAGVE